MKIRANQAQHRMAIPLRSIVAGELGRSGAVTMRKKFELQWLNIAPMLVDHQKDIVDDLVDMYDRGCITENAFMMTLVPEGEPAVDKAKILAERFADFRAELRKRTTMPVGVLIQATIGHGWAPNAETSWQRITTSNGTVPYQFCPLGEEFKAYIRNSMRTIAALKPDFVMVDDDFRLITGRDGCYCPLHIAEFNRLTGQNHTRESLARAVFREPSVAHRFDELQKDSLVALATIMRAAFDEVDPGLECSFCMCAEDVRHAPAIADVLAGKHSPKTIRINNGRYLDSNTRSLSAWDYRTVMQTLGIPDEYKLLAEPDTFPHNRYSTSAAMFHSHLVISLLEGCSGGKLWLTRTGSWEPDSGKAYRTTLATHAGMYRELNKCELMWDGPANPFPKQPIFNFPSEIRRAFRSGFWTTGALMWMGIPSFYTKDYSGVMCLSGNDCELLDDEELQCVLKNNVLIDGAAARALSKRGFSGHIGVDARDWSLRAVTFERTEDGGVIPVSAALSLAEIHPVAGGVQILSTLYHRPSGISSEAFELAPGAVLCTRPDNTKVAVIAIPQSSGHVAFAMLNETRKMQLVRILEHMGGLPLYFAGDEEVFVRTGLDAQGKRVTLLHNNSLDEIENPVLVLNCPFPETIEMLQDNGQWTPVSFASNGKRVTLAINLRVITPVILRFPTNRSRADADR